MLRLVAYVLLIGLCSGCSLLIEPGDNQWEEPSGDGADEALGGVDGGGPDAASSVDAGASDANPMSPKDGGGMCEQPNSAVAPVPC